MMNQQQQKVEQFVPQNFQTNGQAAEQRTPEAAGDPPSPANGLTYFFMQSNLSLYLRCPSFRGICISL